MFTALFLMVAACDPAPPPQSTPVMRTDGGGGRVEMDVNPDGPSPIGVEKFSQRYPQLSGLNLSIQQRVVAAANIVPGPCETCEGRRLAHCMVDKGNACLVADRLIGRALSMAKAGADTDQIKAAINYPDLWLAGLGQGEPVTIHLWHDDDGAFGSETTAAQQLLSAQFGDRIQWTKHPASEEPPARLGVRSRPTWFINGHRFRGAQSAGTLGRFIRFELNASQDE